MMHASCLSRFWCPVLMGLMVVPQLQAAREINLTRTNSTERWVTNLIEVTVPNNQFVDVYTTNVVDRFITNVVTVPETNTIRVTAYRTNVIDAYATNLVKVDATNVIRVTAFQTNVHTLNLTNFETVLVIQTNWVRTTVTNISTVSMPSRETAAAVKPSTTEPVAATAANAAKPRAIVESTGPGAILISGAATGKSSVPRYAEVKLAAAWRDNSNDPLNVIQWKVESDTTSIMAYSQDREFKREMPFGSYRVEVKAQRGSAPAVLLGKGVLRIGAGAVEVAEMP